MTGVCELASEARMRLQISKPLISGRFTSRMIRSRGDSARRSASRPVRAALVANPAAERTRVVAYSEGGWSSTTRTVGEWGSAMSGSLGCNCAALRAGLGGCLRLQVYWNDHGERRTDAQLALQGHRSTKKAGRASCSGRGPILGLAESSRSIYVLQLDKHNDHTHYRIVMRIADAAQPSERMTSARDDGRSKGRPQALSISLRAYSRAAARSISSPL